MALKDLNDEQKQLLNKIIKIFSSRKLRRIVLAARTNIKEDRLWDALRPQYRSLTIQEMEAIKLELTNYRVIVSEVVLKLKGVKRNLQEENELLIRFLNNPILVVSRFHGYPIGTIDHARVNDWRAGKQKTIPSYIKLHLVRQAKVLLKELKL